MLLRVTTSGDEVIICALTPIQAKIIRIVISKDFFMVIFINVISCFRRVKLQKISKLTKFQKILSSHAPATATVSASGSIYVDAMRTIVSGVMAAMASS